MRLSNSQAGSPVLFVEAPGTPVLSFALITRGDGAPIGAAISYVHTFVSEGAAPLGAPSRRFSVAGPRAPGIRARLLAPSARALVPGVRGSAPPERRLAKPALPHFRIASRSAPR
jgi:hypothetical protein